MTLMLRTLLFNLVRRSRSKAILVHGNRAGLGVRIVEAWADARAKSAKLHVFDPNAHEDADVVALKAFLQEHEDVTIICLAKPSAPLLSLRDNVHEKLASASVICCMNGADGFVASEDEVAKEDQAQQEDDESYTKDGVVMPLEVGMGMGAGAAGSQEGGGGSAEGASKQGLFSPRKECAKDDKPSDVWAWLMSTYQSFIVWETEAFDLRLRFSEPVGDDSGDNMQLATVALQNMGISADPSLKTLEKGGRRVNARIVTRENVGSALQVARDDREAVFEAIDAWRDACEHTHDCDDEGFAIGAAFSQGFDISPVVIRGRPVRKSDGGGVRMDCCENMCFLTTRPVATQLATSFAKACEQYLAIAATVK